jgi:hypothetical protein
VYFRTFSLSPSSPSLLFPSSPFPLLSDSEKPLHPPLIQAVRNDDPLDLRGPLPDPFDPGFPEETLGDVLAHVAAAAEDLDRPVRHPSDHLGRVQLGHRGPGVDDLEILLRPGRIGCSRRGDRHQSGRPELDQRIGQHPLDKLVLSDRRSELDPPLRERRRLLDQPPGRPHAARPDQDPLVQEPLLADRQPLPGLAQDVGGRHPDALEDDPGMPVDQVVHVLRLFGKSHPWRIERDEEQGVALEIVVRGALDDGDAVLLGRGDMPFLAVDDPFISIRDGRGRHAPGVRPGPGFGDRVANVQPTLRGRAHEALDLVRRGMPQDDGRRPDQPAQGVGHLADLLVDDHLGLPGQPGPAHGCGQAPGVHAEAPDLFFEGGFHRRVEIPVGQLDLDLERF